MSAKLVKETMKALKAKNAAEAEEVLDIDEQAAVVPDNSSDAKSKKKNNKKINKRAIDVDGDDSDEAPKTPKKPRKNKNKGKRVKLTTLSTEISENLEILSQQLEAIEQDMESDDGGDADLVCGKKFKKTFPSCKCNPRSLAIAYQNGKPYCKCGTVPLYQSLLCVDGWKTYNDTVAHLEQKYSKNKKKNKKTEPNIIYYDPSTVPELDSDEEEEEKARQAALEAEDAKPQKKKAFAETQAVESSGEEGEGEDENTEMSGGFTLKVKPSAIAALVPDSPSFSSGKSEENKPSSPGALAVTTGHNGDEQVKQLSKEQCPMCGDLLGTSLKKESYGKMFCMCGSLPYTTIQNQSPVFTRIRLKVLKEFKSYFGGCVPLCTGHNYPTQLQIFNPLEVDSKGQKIEISEEKKALKGRIFLICNTPKKILDGFIADGEVELGKKCHYLRSAEFRTGSDACNYFEALYRKVVVERQKETRKAVSSFVQKQNMEEAKRLAEIKAERAQWRKLGLKVD